MTRSDARKPEDRQQPLHFRPLYPRDVSSIGHWGSERIVIVNPSSEVLSSRSQGLVHHPLAVWWQRTGSLAIPNHPRWSGFVATSGEAPCGMIEVSPFNRTRSTWRVDCVMVNSAMVTGSSEGPLFNVGSQLLRHCFEAVWEARMWLAEVDIAQKSALSLYRQNGFQPLAQVTYWEISPQAQAEQAKREPDLPNLMPVSNADAQLLYQLDTAAMPPLVRQVFDQQIQDFKVEPVQKLTNKVRRWMQRVDSIRGYVFEPQRKAAMGRFELTAGRGTPEHHSAELTVHPAYTWLYPEIVSHLARLLQTYPSAPLRITSRDYQAEREGYLTQIQADPVMRTLMLSRSVWHKVRESRLTALEGLQLPEVLAGLQPAGKPVPGRMLCQPDPVEGGPVPPSNSETSGRPRHHRGGSQSLDRSAPDRTSLPGGSW